MDIEHDIFVLCTTESVGSSEPSETTADDRDFDSAWHVFVGVTNKEERKRLL